jgi:hypothetical protein
MRIPDPDWAENLDKSGYGYMVFVSHRDLRDVIDDCLTIGNIWNFKINQKIDLFIFRLDET